MYQSGRAGDEAKKRKSPTKSGRVGIYANGILICQRDSYARVLLAHYKIESLHGKLFITIQCHTACFYSTYQ